MNKRTWRVLLVDDDAQLREPLASWLRTEYEFKVETAASRAVAWQAVQTSEEPFDVVLIDDMLLEDESETNSFPIPIGIELMVQIKAHVPPTECIIFTGWSGTERGVEALHAGAYRYMGKPFDHDELALTIQMAAQHHQLKQEKALATQQKQWLQTFIKVGQATTSLQTLDEVLAEVHKQIGKLMDVSEMDIVLYDEASQTLRFELCYDRGKKQAKWERPFGGGLTEWIIVQKQPLLIKHFNEENGMLPAQAIPVFFESDDSEITQSYLGVPLIARDKVIGVINVQSYAPDKFDETDMYVLSAIASQVAGAIQNGRLISNLHDERERRQALLQSSLDAIVAIDNQKRITVFNKQAENFFGYKEEEMLGQTTAVLFENIKVGQKIFDELDGDTFITERQISFKHKNGHLLPSLFSATVIWDNKDQPIGQAGFVRDLQKVKELEARQQAWEELSKAVTTSRELDDILRLIMRSVSHIIPTATGGEFHLNKDGILQLAANTFNFSDEAISAFSLEINQGIAGFVFASGEHKIVKDSEKDPQFKEFNHPEAPTYRSLICVPIQVKEQRLGTLTLTSETVHAFKNVDVPLLMPFARQAAIAIKYAQLLDEANKGLATLKSISEASRNLISQQEPKNVLQAIVEQAKNALHAWRASAILIDHDGCPTELAADGFEQSPNVETVIRKRTGISARVMESMKPCFIENVAKSKENLNEDMQRDGVLATACLPLKFGEKAIGVMWIQYQKPHHFRPTEKEALIIYSEQAALAYDKTRQMQELKHMRQAADALAGAADLSEVLTKIVSSARKVLGADSAAIWSYDDIRKKFLLNYSVAEGIEATIWKRFKQEEPKIGQTADTVMKHGSLVVENVSDKKQHRYLGKSTRSLLKQVKIKSFQGIALSVGSELLGVLYVNYRRTRHFSPEELEIAATFAHHAALALKKARLLEQLSKTQNAARLVAQVTALENLDTTLDSVVNGMVEAVECSAVTLYVYNEQNNELHYPPAVAGLVYPKRTRRLPKVPKDSIVLKMLRRDEPYIVENTGDDPEFSLRRFVLDEQIKSCASIPLIVGAVRVGVLFVNYRQFHRFTYEEMQNIELFANQAAVAIRSAQLIEQLQLRAGIVEALNEAGSAINKSLNSLEFFHEIIQQAVNITKIRGKQISTATIRLLKNDEMHLVAKYPQSLNSRNQHLFRMIIDLEEGVNGRVGVMGRVAQTGESQLVNNVSSDPDHIQFSEDVNSELAVPIKLEGKLIGIISVEHQKLNAFSKDDQKALEALSAHAAVAIRNVQLYQESVTFREVAESFSQTNKLEDIFEIVIQAGMKLAETPTGSLTFWDPHTKDLTDLYWSDEALHRHPSVTRKNGLTEQIVNSREAIIIPDKRLAKNPNPIYKKRGFLSEVGVPIENQGQVLGVLYTCHPEVRHFSKRQVGMLKTLGKQAGVAIARARDFEEMRRLKGFIGNKTAVDWIQIVSTTWGHSLNREVGIAKGRIKLLSAMAHPENKGEFEEQITSLENVFDRIANLTITAPLTYEDVTKAIAINDLLNTYLKRQWKHARFKNIALSLNLQTDLDKLGSVWASPEWLRRGIELIIDNAVFAIQDAGTRNSKIWVTTSSKNGQIIIIIENNGPTIADEVLEHFRHGRAIPKNDGDRGSGIGLQLTKTIFETYRGTMQIAKREPQGATVTFSLPIFQPDKAKEN